MAYIPGTKLYDENGVAYGVKHINNKPRVSSMPYLYDIAEGNVAYHVRFSKIGSLPSLTANVNTDIWSYAQTQPVYLFPTKLPATTDIRLSVIASSTGIVVTTLRGWIENA